MRVRILATSLLVLAAPAGAAWSPDFSAGNLGTDGYAPVLAEYAGDLVVGGSFFGAGPLTACGNLAKFDGTAWTGRLKRGVDGPVTALGVRAGLLYAGGLFTQAGLMQAGGPAAVRNLAVWNGVTWSDVGGGLNDNPLVLTEWNGDLVAAGSFTEAGSTTALRVARWDGASWSPLGTGLGGPAPSAERVQALVVWNGDLWAGGTFTEIDGAPSTGIARWDGVAWTDGGATVTPGTHFHAEGVEALVEYDGALIVGGDLAAVNGVPVNGLARFDGVAWTDLGSDFSAGTAVRELLVYHGDLVALDGPVLGACLEVARWDGSAWSGLGGGIQRFDLFGSAIGGVAFQGSLVVGGNVSATGSYNASFFGMWTDAGTGAALPAAETAGVRVFPNPTVGPATAVFTLARTAPVRVDVLDAGGRVVARIADGVRPAGLQRAAWDGTARDGRPAAAGVYFLRIRADGDSRTSKLVLKR